MLQKKKDILLTNHEDIELSFTDLIRHKPMINKADVLDYMFDSDFLNDATFGEPVMDEFFDEPIAAFDDIYDDGVYSWTDTLAMYVLLHDVVLPSAFVEHALKNKKVPGTNSFNWRSYSQKDFIKKHAFEDSIFPSNMSQKDFITITQDLRNYHDLVERIREYKQKA